MPSSACKQKRTSGIGTAWYTPDGYDISDTLALHHDLPIGDVDTTSAGPVLHIASPADSARVTTSPATIRATVQNVDADRVYATVGDTEIELAPRSEEHTFEPQSNVHPVCRLLLANKNAQVGLGRLGTHLTATTFPTPLPYTTTFRSATWTGRPPVPSCTSPPPPTAPGSRRHRRPSAPPSRTSTPTASTPPSATPRSSSPRDRKSTRLNPSQMSTPYAVFCLQTKTHKWDWDGLVHT